ncbi:MAG: hypothetical protein Q9222_006682, partial [Ikaeria aurantiellina]
IGQLLTVTSTLFSTFTHASPLSSSTSSSSSSLSTVPDNSTSALEERQALLGLAAIGYGVGFLTGRFIQSNKDAAKFQPGFNNAPGSFCFGSGSWSPKQEGELREMEGMKGQRGVEMIREMEWSVAYESERERAEVRRMSRGEDDDEHDGMISTFPLLDLGKGAEKGEF